MGSDDPEGPGKRASGGADWLIGPVEPPGLHVMSWNTRRATGGFSPRAADRWPRRAPKVRALLQAERPSVLGAQEVLVDQVDFIRDSLGPSCRSIGQGRSAAGGGEACPIFYDSDRLELLDWQQSALSDTPCRPGSRSWGNIIPRILVSARFRDRETSAVFRMLNTHLDHLSGRSRVQSARAIRHAAAAAAAEGLPVVLTGDLNADASSPALRELRAGGVLTDSWAAAEHHDSEEWGTYANYRPPRLNRSRIDWVLVSPGTRVPRAGINAQRCAGGWASDHLPVQTVVRLHQEGTGA